MCNIIPGFSGFILLLSLCPYILFPFFPLLSLFSHRPAACLHTRSVSCSHIKLSSLFRHVRPMSCFISSDMICLWRESDIHSALYCVSSFLFPWSHHLHTLLCVPALFIYWPQACLHARSMSLICACKFSSLLPV